MKINGATQIGDTEIKLNDLFGKILWKNNSPSSNFVNSVITLNSDDYDEYEIIYSSTNSDTMVKSTGRIPKGYSTTLSMSFGTGSAGPYIRFRHCTYEGITKLHFTEGVVAYNSTRPVDNTVCIPLYVIGYKTNIFN